MRSILISLILAAAPAISSTANADAPPPPPAAAKPAKVKKAELMDLNSATADQLKTLPGITDAIAAAILTARPFKGKDALLAQKIVDKDEYEKLRPLVIAKQPKKSAAPAPAKKASAAASDDVDGTGTRGLGLVGSGSGGGGLVGSGSGKGAPGAAPPSGTH